MEHQKRCIAIIRQQAKNKIKTVTGNTSLLSLDYQRELYAEMINSNNIVFQLDDSLEHIDWVKYDIMKLKMINMNSILLKRYIYY